MKHIVCYSGGVSSAFVGAMVLKKFGKDNVIWLNHRVNAEPLDVERFEQEFAKAHGMEITYADGDSIKYPGLTPFSVCKEEKAFAIRHGGGESVLCTNRLKTEPFYKWLKENYAEGDIIYYGFDKDEQVRIQRRSSILGAEGYKSDYPLALWENPLDKAYLDQIGVEAPRQYEVFKHANCVPCIKGKILHWLCVFVHDRTEFDRWATLENEIGHSILRDKYLEEFIPYFEEIKKLGIPINEHTHPARFWADVKKLLKVGQLSLFKHGEESEETKPCECLV